MSETDAAAPNTLFYVAVYAIPVYMAVIKATGLMTAVVTRYPQK